MVLKVILEIDVENKKGAREIVNRLESDKDAFVVNASFLDGKEDWDE